MPPTPTDLPAAATLCPWVDRFAEARVVVWGDIVADEFLYGSTTRISREAPALVVCRENTEIRPGGAGNVMVNAAALGAQVSAVGFIGSDAAGTELRHALQTAGVSTEYLISRDDAPTPVKTRVMAGGRHTVRQQILRIDSDAPWPTHDDADGALDEALEAARRDADAVLLSDYGIGNVVPNPPSSITV